MPEFETKRENKIFTDGLKFIQGGLDHHLKDAKCSYSVTREWKFSNPQKELQRKDCQLCALVSGKRTNSAKTFILQKKEILCLANRLGNNSMVDRPAFWLEG